MTFSVDILMTNKNHEDWMVREAIQSTLNQGNLIYIEERKTRGEALQEAFESGKAPYFCIVDADDRLSFGAIERCLEAFTPEVIGVYSQTSIINSTGEIIGHRKLNNAKFDINTQLSLIDAIPFRLFLIRRQAFEGFNTSLDFGIDLDTVLKIMTKGEIVQVPELLYEWRRHSGQMSKDKFKQHEICKGLLKQWTTDILP